MISAMNKELKIILEKMNQLRMKSAASTSPFLLSMLSMERYITCVQLSPGLNSRFRGRVYCIGFI